MLVHPRSPVVRAAMARGRGLSPVRCRRRSGQRCGPWGEWVRAAVLITSNLPFDEWTETFGTERLTGALLDRLTHHVHILELNGQSFRLNHSRARNKGSTT